MKYDIITIGGATEDITLYTKEGVLVDNKDDILKQKLLAFEYGAKIKIDKTFTGFGGGAANAAVCCAFLGFKTAALIAVGDDERGMKIKRNLEKQGVDASMVQVVQGVESGFSFLLVGQDNEHIVFSNRASNIKLTVNETDLENLKNANWIYITSLYGQWQDILDRIFSVHGLKVAWNPGNAQFDAGIAVLNKYFKKTKVLIVNKDEAIELVISDEQYKKKSIKFLKNIKNLLFIIQGWGPEIVVITNGKYGADAYNGVKIYHQDILREKKRVDTTGVGDAFGSSFIAGFELYQGNIDKAMKLSIRNTASVISQQGAQNGLLKSAEITRNYGH